MIVARLTSLSDGEWFGLTQGVALVGRTADCHIPLRSKAASRQHACIEITDKQAAIWDLGSRNGTYLNYRKLAPNEQVSLNSNDRIMIGSDFYEFRWLGSGLDWKPVDSEGDPPLSAPGSSFGFDNNEVVIESAAEEIVAIAKLTKRFRPIKVVSSGGMGKILLVQEKLSGRFVAMKLMLEQALRDKSLIQQFMREAIITARLQHPHIIPIHDLGFLQGDQLYYTMSYIEGTTLKNRMYRNDIFDNIRILRSAALAVQFAHKKGLWHRDLKPQNILVGPHGDTYVIDWGLVSVEPGRSFDLSIPRVILNDVNLAELLIPDTLMRETSEALTQQSLSMGSRAPLIGTPSYMSPEQIRKDPRSGFLSDIWAMGVMAFEALTSRHPFFDSTKNLTLNEVLSSVLYNPIAEMEILDSRVPIELATICLRMLNKDSSQRLSDLSLFIDECTRFLRPVGFGLTIHSPSNSGSVPASATLESLWSKCIELESENRRLRSNQSP